MKQDGLEVNSENRDRATLLTRKAKQIAQTLEQLQQGWKAEAEAMGIEVPTRRCSVEILGKTSAKSELESAIAHLSERSVSFRREDIYRYVFSRLQGFDIEQLDREIAQHPSLVTVAHQRLTTVEALEREIEICQNWMNGQRKVTPLLCDVNLDESRLNSGQAEAIRRTLLSTDRHQIIHGLSGVGKTTALGELTRQLERTGIKVYGFSPTLGAAAELQKELGIATHTVEHLVLSKPNSAKNQLWIIDEAGMISTRQMLAIQHKADTVGARILLVGDTGQSSSIEAGSPLRSLFNHGATTHHIRQIIRQQNSLQRQAVELIADGQGIAALELLNANGYVTELEMPSRIKAIAQQYLALSHKERQQTLIVTGTNSERARITEAIRTGLKAEGTLGTSIQATQLVSRRLTQEESKQIKNYQAGNYIKLHRDYQSTRMQKGQLYKVEECQKDELVVSSYGGRLYRFNPAKYQDKEVFLAQTIDIAIGDNLRWTATNKSQGQINGQCFTVAALGETTMTIVDSKGKTQDISLLQPLAVDYNLVSTSYRAQSKTQKRAIVSATSDPTSSREPFYVKISRQTQELSIYTQDFQKLRTWVARSSAQKNSLELFAEKIESPLLSLRDALATTSSTQPTSTKLLVELTETLQQTVNQAEEKVAQTIRNEKLNLLADAIALGAGLRPIAQWRVEQASVDVGQTRAQERIYKALHDFERSLTQAVASLKANSQQVNATESELHSLLSQKSAPLRAPGSTANCPAHIDPKHWREWVEDSCIHPALAAARLQTIYGDEVYDRLLSEKLATMGSGQYVTKPMARVMKTYQQLAEHGGWWVDSGVEPRSFPLLKAGEKPDLSLYGTFKPNNPRVDEDGKLRKYENPLGLKQKLFERDLNFSAVPDDLAEQIYRKYNVVPTAAEKASGFWYVVYKHPEIPIYRTEGNKKDAAITSLGCVAISGQGVNAGYKAKDQFGNRLPQRVLHPQLDVFAQPGREIRFVFDQDPKVSTILNVRQDLVREAELLKARGCNVYCLQWDGSRGKGIDDYIKNHGSSAFVQADRQAVRVEQVMKQHYRTKYNATAKRVLAELGKVSPERVDLEVYARTIDSGYIEEATRFIGESDTARHLRKQSPEAARQYVEAIASMAGTYKRLADRNVEDLDNWVEKIVQQRIVALNLEDQPTPLRNFQTRRPQL